MDQIINSICGADCFYVMYDIAIPLTVCGIVFAIIFLTLCFFTYCIFFLPDICQRVFTPAEEFPEVVQFPEDVPKSLGPTLEIPSEEDYSARRELIPQEETCCVCLDFRKVVTFQPCNHLACCRNCANVILSDSNLCPLCRKEISSFDIKLDQENKDKALINKKKGVKMLTPEQTLDAIEACVDKKFYDNLKKMGYSRLVVLKALRNTGNMNVERAVEWIVQNLENKGIESKIQLSYIDELVRGSYKTYKDVEEKLKKKKNEPPSHPLPRRPSEMIKEEVDTNLLNSLIQMGYKKHISMQALLLTENKGIEEALKYITDFQEDEKKKKIMLKEKINKKFLKTLTEEMGYDKKKAEEALISTSNSSVQAAVEYMLSK